MRKVGPSKGGPSSDEPVDERLKNIDPKMIELISNEVKYAFDLMVSCFSMVRGRALVNRACSGPPSLEIVH